MEKVQRTLMEKVQRLLKERFPQMDVTTTIRGNSTFSFVNSNIFVVTYPKGYTKDYTECLTEAIDDLPFKEDSIYLAHLNLKEDDNK